MRFLIATGLLFLASMQGLAQEIYVNPMFEGRDRTNPEIEIIEPVDNGLFTGSFVVEVKNFDYLPELATSALREFAIGTDSLGTPLVFAEGHLHGWVFEVDADGRKIRNDAGVPTPASYLRFYGAGGATYVGDRNYALYGLTDELPPGRYKAYFQLQQNDHTGALQASAPAFPGIDSVLFRVASPSSQNADRPEPQKGGRDQNRP